MHKRLIGLTGFAAAMMVAGSIVTLGVSGTFDSDDNPSPTALAVASTPAGTSTVSAPAAETMTIPEIYEKANPSVALIQTQSGSGTGFVVDDDGHLLTNYHVVSGFDDVRVTFPGASTPIDGTVVGVDPGNDLAVVKVTLPEGVEPLALGDSGAVQVGETAIAIGNPFDLPGTLTAGVISGLDRPITTTTGRPVRDAIQTDAPINPGNSGGPLLNAQGEVIGINTQIENPTGQGNIGIGFAVPINTAKQFLPDMIAGDEVGHAYLGISGVVVDDAVVNEYDLTVTTGVMVQEVTPGGPADDAGLQGTQGTEAGDVIVAIDGDDVVTFEDLTSALDTKNPDDQVELTIVRAGEEQTVQVTLAAWPNS